MIEWLQDVVWKIYDWFTRTDDKRVHRDDAS